ncbi:MAG: 4-(cytidine 5'-diphospho)-2-C-methyl-D-erythritol kinase [Gemmatimonadetes bacterium]|nr:4-(cytidine 5'-diphospho)-2-C-methyl-D-erythritol kinase [Gemmatimonadota bacterium]
MILRSFAKINLSIHLLGKRPDGYHEIVTLMETVDLADDVEVTGQETGTAITCSDPAVPTDGRNLAHRAADLVRDRYGLGDRGVRIHIEKRIPVAAGLAGGSGNAAMTLHGLNALWSLDLREEELMDLAAELGSDVPFCLYGGMAVASGRGEKVDWLDAAGSRHYVLVCPPLEVTAGWAYGRSKLELTKDGSCINLVSSVVRAGDVDRLAPCLHNDLEPAVRAAFPEINGARGLLADAGLKGILMSGSGPAVFGLTPGRAVAERIADDLRERVEPSWRVFAVSSKSRREAGV